MAWHRETCKDCGGAFRTTYRGKHPLCARCRPSEQRLCQGALSKSSQGWLSGEALLRAQLQEQGLFRKWRKGAPSALLWALDSLDEDLWARGVVCPAERAVMLGATSKRLRALLAGLQRRVPAAVRVVGSAGMEAVAGGLRLLLMQGWCQVVRLDLNRGFRRPLVDEDPTGGTPIGAVGARRLAEVLGQCPSLMAML